MSHNPHVVTTPWQQRDRSDTSKIMDRPALLDPIRVARLAVLAGLIAFWVALLMLLF